MDQILQLTCADLEPGTLNIELFNTHPHQKGKKSAKVVENNTLAGVIRIDPPLRNFLSILSCVTYIASSPIRDTRDKSAHAEKNNTPDVVPIPHMSHLCWPNPALGGTKPSTLFHLLHFYAFNRVIQPQKHPQNRPKPLLNHYTTWQKMTFFTPLALAKNTEIALHNFPPPAHTIFTKPRQFYP